jgi:hypothetical protein
MNETVRGSAKSATILTNGAGIVGLAALWNNPEMMTTLPPEARWILLAIMGLNILLRYKTNQSVQEKGKKATPIEMLTEILKAPELDPILDQIVRKKIDRYLPKNSERRQLVRTIIGEMGLRGTPPKDASFAEQLNHMGTGELAIIEELLRQRKKELNAVEEAEEIELEPYNP